MKFKLTPLAHRIIDSFSIAVAGFFISFFVSNNQFLVYHNVGWLGIFFVVTGLVAFALTVVELLFKLFHS